MTAPISALGFAAVVLLMTAILVLGINGLMLSLRITRHVPASEYNSWNTVPYIRQLIRRYRRDEPLPFSLRAHYAVLVLGVTLAVVGILGLAVFFTAPLVF